MSSNLFLNVHWPLSRGAVPHLALHFKVVLLKHVIKFGLGQLVSWTFWLHVVSLIGRPALCHHASRGVGGDQEVHARTHSHLGEEGGAYPRGY